MIEADLNTHANFRCSICGNVRAYGHWCDVPEFHPAGLGPLLKCKYCGVPRRHDYQGKLNFQLISLRDHVLAVDNVTHKEKLVLLILSYQCDRTNTARIGMQDLAGAALMAVWETRAVVEELEKKGLVTRQTSVGRGNLTTYRFTMPPKIPLGPSPGGKQPA